MRQIIILLVFAAVGGTLLWWSTSPSEESQGPRRLESAKVERQSEPEPARESRDRSEREATPPRELAGDLRQRDPRQAGEEVPPEDDEEDTVQERSEREVERILLEAEAASIASELGLVRATELEARVNRAVPEGSLPPDELEAARDDKRRELMADEVIARYLAEQKLGEGASPAEIRRVSDFGRTLLSTQDETYRDRVLPKAVEALRTED